MWQAALRAVTPLPGRNKALRKVDSSLQLLLPFNCSPIGDSLHPERQLEGQFRHRLTAIIDELILLREAA